MASSSSERGRETRAEEAVQSTKLVIAGGFGVGKTTLVASISEIEPVNTDVWMTASSTAVDRLEPGQDKATTTVGMDFGRITLARDGLQLFLFGTPGQPRFWPMWDDMCRGAMGALVLVDTQRLDESFPAVNYFDLDSDVPVVVAVNRFNGELTHPLAEIREALALKAHVPIVDVDARDRDSVKSALIVLVQHALNSLAPASIGAAHASPSRT
jgi:signal recognition particle receptor subunit beta